MKRIFVVSWFYPPVNSSEALVTWKLLHHSRYRYDVFTQKKSLSWSYGDNSELESSPNVRCIYAENAELTAWSREAWRFFLAHREDYDLVMTRSMPPECHFVGLQIKRAFPEIKWIASFGDPIAENPYEILTGSLYSPYSLKNPLHRKSALRYRLSPLRMLKNARWHLLHGKLFLRQRALARWEKHTLRLADRLIFNNRSQLRYMAKTADALRKARLVRHSYEPALYPPPGDKAARKKLRFVFLGQLNALRRALPLLQAIERLRDCTDDLSERAEFVFFGELPDADLAYILRRELGGLVFVRKPIAYRDSLREAAAADWLIHIDANILPVCRENVFFAGKIADYFGAGRPILAITMAEGDAADCLRRAGARLLSFSANEIKQALYQIIFRGQSAAMDRAVLAGFSSGRAAAVLDERVVKELL